MNIEQNVIEKLRQLPLEKQQELLDFMDSLANKHQVSESENLQSPRIMGLFAGKGWISEDFNDPLPDEFWDN